MASENVQTLTDANFEQTVNHTAAGARRLLGGMVRPVPASGADGRRARQRLQRRVGGRQDERRREPGDADALQHPRHPDAAALQGRQLVEQVVGLADKDELKKLIDKHV